MFCVGNNPRFFRTIIKTYNCPKISKIFKTVKSKSIIKIKKTMKTTNNFVLGMSLLGCSEKKSKLGHTMDSAVMVEMNPNESSHKSEN